MPSSSPTGAGMNPLTAGGSSCDLLVPGSSVGVQCSSSQSLLTANITSIVLGTVLGTALLVAIGLLVWERQRRKMLENPGRRRNDKSVPTEIDSEPKFELDGTGAYYSRRKGAG